MIGQTIVWRVYCPTNLDYASSRLSAAETDFIENEINRTKPIRQSGGWDVWIKAPFDYPLPVKVEFTKRFLPEGYERNALYASFHARTSVWETAYYFRLFRLASKTEFLAPWEERKIFSVESDLRKAVQVSTQSDAREILDPNSHKASHRWAWKHLEVDAIIYRSVRDPDKGQCACVYSINLLAQHSKVHEKIYYAIEGQSTVRVKSDVSGLPSQVAFPTPPRKANYI